MSEDNSKNNKLPISKEKAKINNIKDNNNKDLILKINKEKEFIKKYNNEELNIFRDDILQYFKENFQEYSKTLKVYLLKINKIEKNFEEMTNTINANYNKVISTQANMNTQLDKLKDYEQFYNKTNEKLISHEIRLNNIRDDFSKAIQKYDKIYLDNLELPGYIGRCAKYKNCQFFFNDIIKEINTLNQFKEKNILDLKSYKDKLESIIKSFNILVDNNNTSQIKYINTLNQKNISDCQGMVDLLAERIRELRVENAKYSMDIINKSDELSKRWDKVEDIKKEILLEFDIRSNEYKKKNDIILNKFNEYKKEYKIIKEKFFELAEFIKDIRFKQNVKILYGEKLTKKEIKNIYDSLSNMDINKNKKYETINKDEDIDLLKDISSIENITNKTKNENNTNNINNENNENNANLSGEMEPEKINEYIKNNKKIFKRQIEYNSPILLGIKNSLMIGKNDKISLNKNYRTLEHNNKDNSKNKNLNIYSNKINNYNSFRNIEKNDKNNSEIIFKKKGNKKIFINSKEDKDKEKEKKEINNINDINDKKDNIERGESQTKETIINNLPISSKKNNSKKNNNNNGVEDSNSNFVDNQSTLANINNSINDNNISISSISTLCLNNNNNKNFVINDICSETNDKVIKELASELEQSTAKKDIGSNKKDEKFKLNKKIIEPLNLVKAIQEEKELPDSSSLRDKTEVIFLNSNRDNVNDSNKKTENINNINNYNFSLNKLINEKENNSKIKNDNDNNNNNDLILYGNNPKAIDKKFIMTDKKLLDLEEYTKEKIIEIISQIEKLKNNNNKNSIKNSIKKKSYNNIANMSMKEKNTFNTYKGILGYNYKNKNETITTNNKTKYNVFNGFNSKNDENNNLTSFEKNKNTFNSTGFNFHKSKLYNIEQISHKIFNSSCKKIKPCSNLNDLENNFQMIKANNFTKNNILKKNDNNSSEQKQNDNKENKKWDINKIRNNELKKRNCRNNSLGNLNLTHKKEENNSFNEADIKMVYLNKFVNDYLPYAPYNGEESFYL